jgi:hypothetical protein
MGEVDQLPAAAPVDPVQAYRDAVAYAGMIRQGALGSAAIQFAQDGDQATYGAAVQAADIAYHEAVLKSAVAAGQPHPSGSVTALGDLGVIWGGRRKLGSASV